MGAVIFALVANGCTSAGGSEQTSAEASNEPQDVTITAVDYRYAQAPTQIAGGVIDLTFENQGDVTHEVSLTGIGDTTPEQYMEDLEGLGGNGLSGEALPEYVDQVAVPFVYAKGGQTRHATFTLTEGNYALYCAFTDAAKGGDTKGVPHYRLGMVQALTVTGGPTQPTLPEADGTITATDFELDVDIEAGDEIINFVNEGPSEIHMSTVEMYPVGVDAAEATAAFRTQLEPGPSPDGLPGATGIGFSGFYSEGLGGTFRLYKGRFVPGRTYLFQCYMFDRTGGESHAKEYGQWAVVTIE